MTRELTINGQAVDLLPDSDITLEYVSNFFGEPGKISLPRSYTIRIPRTSRNASILDHPGQPGHASSTTRRFLSARFYRNGIDLLGEAKAYIMSTMPEGYEIALVWNALDALQTLSQSDATLNDLPDLPVLPWISPNGLTPDYTESSEGGALFAWYNSGLGALLYPDAHTSTHPSMRVLNLIDRILTGAGVPYELSEAARRSASELMLLAAPGRHPDRNMEISSGSVAQSVELTKATANNESVTLLYMQGWEHGWDAPSTATTVSQVFTTGDNDTHRVLFNMQAPVGVDLSDCAIAVYGQVREDNMVNERENLMRVYFTQSGSKWVLYSDEEIRLSGWPEYSVELEFSGSVSAVMTPYDPAWPMFAANRVHESIDISKDNRFPLAGNLPDIKQMDFLMSCMVMLGWTPVIKDGTLRLMTLDEVLDFDRAYDWTAKVDITDRAPIEVKYALDGWAQLNRIRYQDDAPLGFDPEGKLFVQDGTLAEQREYFNLPFAASMGSTAQHYRIKEGNEVEDIDIAPRVFRLGLGIKGMTLRFDANLYGDSLISARYSRLQEIVRVPVLLSVDIRLNEIDLAQLDLTRPVYLGQYGQYYAILKIQTSNTDLCKVELLQLP